MYLTMTPKIKLQDRNDVSAYNRSNVRQVTLTSGESQTFSHVFSVSGQGSSHVPLMGRSVYVELPNSAKRDVNAGTADSRPVEDL
jgi:hypothetical protein